MEKKRGILTAAKRLITIRVQTVGPVHEMTAMPHQEIRLIHDESGGFLYFFSLNDLIKPDGT